jgi:hypothetical protein
VTYPKERTLPDDYPVHAGYAYVADGKPIIASVSGTVSHLKHDMDAQEIKNCDLVGRSIAAGTAAN